MEVKYLNFISTNEYNSLRVSVGWNALPEKQAQNGLDNSTLIIAAYANNTCVGVARLIWDRGYSALIKDVIVLSQYQGLGIGKTMMNMIISFINENIESGWSVTVDLVSAINKEKFYEKFGFEIYSKHRGIAMDLRIKKD